MKSNIIFLIRPYFAYHIPQFLKDADNAFFERRLDRARFVVFRCHGNIDFCKITIIRNFSLNLVSG